MTFTKLLVILLLFSEALLMMYFILQIKNIGSNKPITIEENKPDMNKSYDQTICSLDSILISKCTDHNDMTKNLSPGKIYHLRCSCGWRFSGFVSGEKK